MMQLSRGERAEAGFENRAYWRLRVQDSLARDSNT